MINKSRQILTALTLLVGLNARADQFFNCSQQCGYTSNAETISYSGVTKFDALSLIARSCNAAGRDLQGVPECSTEESWYNLSNEAYARCAHGNFNGYLSRQCRVRGELLIKEPGKLFRSVRMIEGFDMNAFSRAETDFAETCEGAGKSWINGLAPGTTWECVRLYRDLLWDS